ncbi:MAG: hypothetical protein M3O50_02910 [Myxococcota bacterium]|nr:hypothetical protein [Myxococcota bacterium]
MACAILCVAHLACSAPVAGGLDDIESNRVLSALVRSGVEAAKEPDPSVEGRWRVSVARDDVPRAVSVMREEELPRTPPPGVLDAVGKGSLVPSEAAEQAQLVTGIAGDLERTLEGIDGVLSARVHLSVPMASPLRDMPRAEIARGSGSVLLEHRGSTPPLSVESVQRLVAGGVASLVPNDVAVVLISRPAPPSSAVAELSHVGPIAVARASMRGLQAALVALVALVALLATATLVFYTRWARMRAESATQQSAERSI